MKWRTDKLLGLLNAGLDDAKREDNISKIRPHGEGDCN